MEMDGSSLVSICIPTYNRAEMVSKAIDSALSQSYQNIEVIVVDNASHDDIESVIAKYQDTRLMFYKNKKNLGQFGNFNRCIELSKGKYIHILHSDDYIDSNFTKTCVEFMESHPDVAMTFTSVQVLFNDTQKRNGIYDHDIVFSPPDGFRMLLETGNPINCPSVMLKNEVYSSVGLFSFEYPYAGDYYQWLKISRHFNIAFVADALLFCRQGEHSESSQRLFKNPSGYMDNINIFIRIIDELGGDVSDYRRELNTAIRGHMRLCLFAGIMRSDWMTLFSPLVFMGFALNTWTLIHCESFGERVRKCAEFFAILILGCGFIIPGGRNCLRKIFRLKEGQY